MRPYRLSAAPRVLQGPVRWLAPILSLLLAACASVGDYAGSPGSPYPTSQQAHQQLSGVVSNVDHGNRRFLLQEDGGERADIAYDQGTRLVYQGREQSPGGLEPGDRLRVLASRDGSLWRADDIEVLADGRGGNAANGGGERRGAIAFVDRRARVIGYTEGGYSGGEQRVAYDDRTLVEYRGQRYATSDLERGDLVRMSLARGPAGWVAERIVVEVSSRER